MISQLTFLDDDFLFRATSGSGVDAMSFIWSRPDHLGVETICSDEVLSEPICNIVYDA